MNKYKIIRESILTFIFFLVIAILLWRVKGHIFYLFNFLYIGLAAAVGELLFGILPSCKKIWGRKISQLLIGIYLLVVLGFMGRENMQIEGFFFYLLAGVFSGPVLHYAIAKIGGTFFFGRGWCAWACWTSMLLDFLPWVKPQQGRLKHWGLLRYLHFFIVMIAVLILWFAFDFKDFHHQHAAALNWLIIGNLSYFIVGIIIAAILKDNRAFCKYICPIPVLMKIGTRFSIMKITIDEAKCSGCGTCEENCPMNVKLLKYLKNGQRVSSTECIACQQCVNVCPTDAIRYSKGVDVGWKEYLNFR